MLSMRRAIRLLARKQLITSSASKPRRAQPCPVLTIRRFEMDYILATLQKPYVAILDGITSM
jgi:hypothetical protein